jgi:hypothetical protein
MPQDLAGQILTIVQRKKVGDRPTTLFDLARHFGADVAVITSCVRLMIDQGLVEPSMVTIRGRQTLHGLLPHHPAAGADSVAADAPKSASERPGGLDIVG